MRRRSVDDNEDEGRHTATRQTHIITIDAQIREVVSLHAGLAIDTDLLADDDDLYVAGLKSHSNVDLMLAIEHAFDVEFRDEMLTRSTFRSIESIRSALAALDVTEQLPA